MDNTFARLRLDSALASLGVSPDELVGLAEIAEMLGVRRSPRAGGNRVATSPAESARNAAEAQVAAPAV